MKVLSSTNKTAAAEGDECEQSPIDVKYIEMDTQKPAQALLKILI